jgi:hypothetical protein
MKLINQTTNFTAKNEIDEKKKKRTRKNRRNKKKENLEN